jgi:hypothetical protein
MQSKYALAVKIDNDLYEIFDILFFESGTEIDNRYKKGTSLDAIAILAPDLNNIKIGSTLVDNKFFADSSDGILQFDPHLTVYTFLSENKVFGMIVMDQKDNNYFKYEAAFENKVIVLNVSDKNQVGFGDIWDSKNNKLLPAQKD